MNTYILQLQDYIATGNQGQAFEELFRLLLECREAHPEAGEEIQQVRGELLVLSGNYHDMEKRFKLGTVDVADFTLTKNKVRQGLISVLDHLARHALFRQFLDDLEEEDAWQKALGENTISAYEAYFSQYPKGKYAPETERILADLKAKLRHVAEAEKERRKIFQQMERSAAQSGQPSAVSPSIEPQQWWENVPNAWRPLFMGEIGAIGTATEAHISRILNLKTLDLSNRGEVHTLEPLRHLRAVRTLVLRGTPLAQLDGIETLVNLRHLDISATQVRSIVPLLRLKALRKLVHGPLPPEELRALAKALPKCKLLRRS